MFDETYIIREQSISELIDQIDRFETILSKWSEKHPYYTSEMNIQKDEDGDYFVEITVKRKDE